MAMHCGKFNRRVTLQRPAQSQDANGGVLTTWQDVEQAWANIRPIRGDELVSAQQASAEISHVITMWFRPALRSNWRIKYEDARAAGERLFDIMSIIHLEVPNAQHELRCNEVLEVDS